MKILREIQPELDKKIMCACGEPTCWHGIELSPDGFYFYPDASDETVSFIFDFPKGLTLARFEDVTPEFTKEDGINMGLEPFYAETLASVHGSLQRIYDHEIINSERKAGYYQKEYDELNKSLHSREPSFRVLKTLHELAKDDPELAQWMENWK